MSDAKTKPSPRTSPGETFVHCESGSRESDAAIALARGLADRRGGTVQHAKEVTDRAGERVVVVDGCREACVARLLDARGIEVEASLTLDKVGMATTAGSEDAAPEAVAKAELLLDRGSTRARPHRPAPPSAAPFGDARVHTIGDYLLAIDWLTSPIGPCGALVLSAPTLAAHVSVALGVSRASAGEMLGRLEERGLVRRGEGKGLVLTDEGEHEAGREVRKHRVLECFVVDTLGYARPECFRLARELAPSFDDDAVARLDASLGHPERCPHGWPLDPGAAHAEAHDLVTLATLEAGASALVVRLTEQEHDILERLLADGVEPGTAVAVKSIGAAHVRLVTGGRPVTLTRKDAARVLVDTRAAA